ncbi:unnamed protein product [Rhizophagus irregularis]|nr:unnamed protein product [Rhizophagus irregularis]
MKAIRNKKLEFVQWPKNNNRTIVHAGFQAIGDGQDQCMMHESDFFLNKAKYIEGDDYVLGDSAYPISSFLITPFKNPFNHRQRQFNFIDSKHRVVVEHAFGRLKTRFKALKELSINDQNDDDDDDDDDQYDWEDESDEILKLEGELERKIMLINM